MRPDLAPPKCKRGSQPPAGQSSLVTGSHEFSGQLGSLPEFPSLFLLAPPPYARYICTFAACVTWIYAGGKFVFSSPNAMVDGSVNYHQRSKKPSTLETYSVQLLTWLAIPSHPCQHVQPSHWPCRLEFHV